ncbi:hypothetical protein [Agrobacterium larrymoorei]|uniref:Transmembrane protein n=1 Tax=Agrobacterium larrymoorei TaxID=160699 RepID=A0A4D7DYZ2_9HYPH|nr:hypothetical protein [Agrobacterium larrymoorei]QCI99392.1 hypothetical protein CFBP5473_15360 [Agrobacterium larrymoorei]QYA08934.1 hypothetical protein J5285_16105 [Agrobacterium larrymoorei]
MSLATDRLNNILIELPKYKSQWQLNVASPYVRAYDLAIDNYNKKMQEQAARDKMAAELFVMSASILTGSVMMAVFATTSLRTLAGRAALRVICNQNLNTTFNAFHAVSESKVLMFALGGVLDEVKKLAGKHVTAAVEGLTSSDAIASAPTALNFLTRMEDFINVNHICVHNFVQGVRDDASISDANKTHIAELVGKTPFCNPPEARRVDENRLSQKMELLFYMDAVLESDKLVKFASVTSSTTMLLQDVEFSRTPIAQLPSSTDYPREIGPQSGGIPITSKNIGQRVKYENLGSQIRQRIDTLSKLTGNSSFYPEQSAVERFFDPTGNAQLLKAEQIINRLSIEARPKELTDVKVI